MERKTIWKWFFVWDFEKEEQWLNEMASQGWALVGVGFCRYEFERCEPDAYIIRMQMDKNGRDYIQFIKDTGAEYIGRMVNWIYFRKDASLGAFELFSDIDSRIEHLKRIGYTLLMIGIGNLLIGIVNSLGTNSRFGWINLLCATFLMYGLGRIHGKIEALEKERTLRE